MSRVCFLQSLKDGSLPYCDYLSTIETVCLPLYNEVCHPGMAGKVLHGVWIRQDLEASLGILPSDQFFWCNTTTNFLHYNEIAAMKQMIESRDWVANSKYA